MSSVKQQLGILAIGASCFLASCKTAPEQKYEVQAQPAVKAPQCSSGIGYRGSCQVTDVAGRQPTSTDSARTAAVGELVEFRFAVPPGSPEAHTQVTLFKKSGPVADWQIDQALDLYSRKACIAEISGGVFNVGLNPKLTVRVLLNLVDDGQTGFAEVSDYTGSKPIFATLALKCAWQL